MVVVDFPVQQLEGRVERVVNAALISLFDEGSHRVAESAAVVPNAASSWCLGSRSSMIVWRRGKSFYEKWEKIVGRIWQVTHS